MIIDLGLVDYEKAYAVQMEMVARRKLGEVANSLLFAEHEAVITVGRGGVNTKKRHILADDDTLAGYGIKVLDVDRGGGVTLHARGQLVAYPIVDLRERIGDLHRYMRFLEEAVIRMLERFSIRGFAVPGRTGVWLDAGRKIASIGIGARSWITYHGLSVNVNIDLGYFSMIKMCGLDNVRAASMLEILRKVVPLREVKARLAKELAGLLDIPDNDHEYIPFVA